MSFIDTLNETTVTYVNLDLYWNGAQYPVGSWGWEAISWTGEVRSFTTFEAANAWRLAECRAR